MVNLGKIVGLSIYLRKIGKSLYSDRGDWSTTGDILDGLVGQDKAGPDGLV